MSIETVYFLGAGASRSLFPGMPLARELTIDYLLGLNECPYQAWKDNHDRVKASDPGLRTKPIEEILNGGLARNLTWPLVGLVSCALWKGRGNGIAEGLKSWLRRIRPKNPVLLTTNYDNLVERHLLDMRDEGSRGAMMCLDYGVPSEMCVEDTANNLWHGCDSKDRVVLLKLHGSVGWSKCLRTSCGKYRLSMNYAFGAANTSQGNIPIGESCRVCGGDPWPVLVAPARNKTYDDRLLREIWARAGQLLGEARRVVFGGFSLQPVDLQVQTLLGKSVSDHLKEVLIVDRDAKSILPRFEKIYGNIVRAGAADWEEFIASDS